MATAREKIMQKLAPHLNLIPPVDARRKFSLVDSLGNPVEVVAGSEPSAMRLILTPELATLFLENVPDTQRKFRTPVARRYAEDMTQGMWRFTSQPLGFNEILELCDGQHRCLSVVMTGQSVEVWAIFNMPNESFLCVDIGGVRTVTEMAGFLGKEVSNQRVAIANHMRMGFSMSKQNQSKSSLLDFMEHHAAALDFVCGTSTSGRGIGQAAVLAPVARAYYSQSHDRLREFTEVLKTNIPQNGDKDTAALTLLKWLMGQPTGGGAGVKQVIYAKTSNALEAFCRYEPLSKLYAAKREIFLLPEEKEASE